VNRLARLLLLLSPLACQHPADPTATTAGSAVPPAAAVGSGSAGGSAAPTPAPAKDPWVTPDAGVESPEARRKRADAALGRVAAIEPKLAKVRDLTFVHEVPTAYQSTDDFRAFLQREITKELPPAKSKDISAALAHIGLFAKNVDLAKMEEQTMATQAGAYYDPAAKKFFLVMVPDSELMLDTMSAHELTHGLQDQHFDLTKFMEAKSAIDNDDVVNARRFIVEGDATFTMLLYAVAQVGKQPTVGGPMIKLLRSQIEQFAGMDIAAFSDMTKKQGAAFGAIDPAIKASIDSMDDLPPAVLVPLLDSYMKGALVVLVAFEQGGWRAVDALYASPPESTEQVLHPTTKLFPKREHPRRVTLGKVEGAELVANTMGELLWQVYFGLWVKDRAAEASEGWGGDRFVVVRRKDDRLIGELATVWDSAADATQFADAYAASLAKRFPGVDPAAVATGVARPDGGKVFVRTIGTKVFIVDGADDVGALDQLVKTTKFE
jgi:hypothetical protein